MGYGYGFYVAGCRLRKPFRTASGDAIVKAMRVEPLPKTGGSVPDSAVHGGMHTIYFPSKFANPGQTKNSPPLDLASYTKQLSGATLSLLTGLFALWLTLTIQGFVGLANLDGQMLFSPATKGIIAAALALMIIVAGFPLLLPWLFAFFAFDILAPASIVWSKWLLCAVAGILIGVAALWLDAVVCSIVTAGPWSSLNVSLLSLTSIPAAVVGGATCLAGAATAKLLFDRQP